MCVISRNSMRMAKGLDHRSNGLRATAGPKLGHSLLIDVSPSLGISKVSLSLAEFGQVQRSNLLRFLNLLLVSSNPALQLVNKILHPFMILSVLIGSISELLDPAFRLAKIFLGVSETPVF